MKKRGRKAARGCPMCKPHKTRGFLSKCLNKHQRSEREAAWVWDAYREPRIS